MNGKKTKILILTRYDQMGASSRLRFFEYTPRLIESGCFVKIQSLLPDEYLKSLYGGKGRSKLLLLKAYIKRFFFLLFFSKNYDIVWVEKELFPGFPTFFDYFFMNRFKNVVLDYDDSVHLNYAKSGWLRKNKLENLMAKASVVFAGSPFLKEVAEVAGAKKVVRIPTAVQPQKFKEKGSAPTRIGWVGSPASESYLLDLYEVVKTNGDSNRVEWIFLGVKNPVWKSLGNVKTIHWSPEAEKKVLKQLDFGIMPLRESDWEKGKCSYKILLYNAWGVPALASPVGMNNEVVIDSENGFLVADNNWQNAIEQCLSIEESDYQVLSQKSLNRVQMHYSYSVVYERIHNNFKQLLKG